MGKLPTEQRAKLTILRNKGDNHSSKRDSVHRGDGKTNKGKLDQSNQRCGRNSRRYLPAVHAVPSHTALLHRGKIGIEADEREGSQFGFCFVTKVLGHLVWETGAGVCVKQNVRAYLLKGH